jgi:hypothetical protein
MQQQKPTAKATSAQSTTTKSQFEQMKKSLNNISSWEFISGSESEAIIPKFTEYAKKTQAELFIKILKSLKP